MEGFLQFPNALFQLAGLALAGKDGGRQPEDARSLVLWTRLQRIHNLHVTVILYSVVALVQNEQVYLLRGYKASPQEVEKNLFRHYQDTIAFELFDPAALFPAVDIHVADKLSHAEVRLLPYVLRLLFNKGDCGAVKETWL